MNETQELELLMNCFSHRELARIYLISLKERDRLVEELKQCKADRDAAIAGQESLQKACAVKHGRWIANKEGRHICSECGKPPLYRESGTTFARSFYKAKTEHCPHCGARMDGE